MHVQIPNPFPGNGFSEFGAGNSKKIARTNPALDSGAFWDFLTRSLKQKPPQTLNLQGF
jgi:hypothetical protein